MTDPPTEPLDALVIAPHPDDAELGMGGAILKMLSEGRRVGILDLTDGEPTPHGSGEIRRQETANATQILGLSWRDNLGLPNRSLETTLASRSQLANTIRKLRPRWLFAPYWVDAHPDHMAAATLVEDARFWSKLTKSTLEGAPYHPERIYNYFSIHLRIAPQPDFILDITDEWPLKMAAIECYQSQFVVGREEMRPSLLERFATSAAYWGQMIGREYGEPFACREPIGLRSLDALV